YSYHHPRPLPSFPTRRSSDLDVITIDASKVGYPGSAGPLLEHKLGIPGEDIDYELKGADKQSALNRIAVSFVGDDYVQLTAQSRSEEHTSELQSQSNLVCRLL